MTDNPLADALAKLVAVGAPDPPCFKVIASAHCEPGKMLIMDPIGLALVSDATLAKHPGLKIIVCHTDEAAQQVTEWARDLGVALIDDGD